MMAYDTLDLLPSPCVEAVRDGREPIYGLQRLPHRGGISGAWRATVKRQGRHIARTFKDSTYGSEQAAFEQARAYRDTVIRALPPMTLREKATRLRSNNTSGVAGVYRNHDPAPRWVAYICLPQGVRTKGFSVTRYGEEAAKARAVAQRQEWLAHMPPAFHIASQEAAATAHRHFPERLECVPDATNTGRIPSEADDAILNDINRRFDDLRPLRLRVSIQRHGADRLRGTVAFTRRSTLLKQIDVSIRNRSLGAGLAVIGVRLHALIQDLCGPEIAQTFHDGHPLPTLHPGILEGGQAIIATLYIPRCATAE
ncbi:hypothetical protein [Labrys neptuniae]